MVLISWCKPQRQGDRAVSGSASIEQSCTSVFAKTNVPLPRTVHETYQEKVVLVWYGTFVEDDEELVDGILLGSISQDIGLMTAASDAIEMLLVPT